MPKPQGTRGQEKIALTGLGAIVVGTFTLFGAVGKHIFESVSNDEQKGSDTPPKKQNFFKGKDKGEV